MYCQSDDNNEFKMPQLARKQQTGGKGGKNGNCDFVRETNLERGMLDISDTLLNRKLSTLTYVQHRNDQVFIRSNERVIVKSSSCVE